MTKFTCQKCNKCVGSKHAMINHQRWHRSLEILAQSRRMRLAKNMAQHAAAAKEKGGAVSKSAPAKLKCLLSPRRNKQT